MKRLQALTAIVCAATVLSTGIAPASILPVDSYAAEIDDQEIVADLSEAENAAVSVESETDTEESKGTDNEEESAAEITEAADAADAADMGQEGASDESDDEEKPETVETEADEVAIETVESFAELQETAPADLDTASSYVIDLTSGEAEGSNAETLSLEEAFGIEEQGTADAILSAIEETDLYTVDEAQTDRETAVVYSPYARHRILVYTTDEIVDTFGAVEAAYLTKDGGYRLCYETDEATKTAYDALVNCYGADAVILDVAVSVSTTNKQPKGWGASYMHLDGISQKANTNGVGKTVTVAILDSGISSNHEVFSGKKISGKATSMLGGSVADDNGHGTAVAGIIAESTSDNVILMPIKIADANGESSLDYMISGLTYASENGADIANLSLNACYGDTTLSDEQIKADIATLEKMLQAVTKNGMTICVSAGNDARDMGKVYNYPAISDYVLSVGSIDSNGQKSRFSSFGSELDFVAPGEGVQCAWNSGNSSWKSLSGTSMSAPYISAACAMVISTSSKTGMSAVEKELSSIAKDLGTSGKDSSYGYGVPIFKETASYADGRQNPSQSEDATLIDGITLPYGWDADDPMSFKAYQHIYGNESEELKYVNGKLQTSSITAKTRWKLYDSSAYAEFQHDSKNTSGKQIVPVIDVSYHNDSVDSSSDNINWTKVKADGVQGVMIRCGYRAYASGTLNTDKQFFNFIKNAKAAGLKVGVYFFSQATSVSEAEAEANYAMARVKESGVKLDLPIAIDIEYAENSRGPTGRLYNAKLSKTEQTNIGKAFCAKVKNSGYTPMVYASSGFLVSWIDGNAIAGTGSSIWMARYRYAAYSDSSNFYNNPVTIWQCTSDAAVNGISTRVDLNYWYTAGTSVSGWFKDSKGWYYLENRNTVKNRWIYSGGEYYYLKSNGYMAANEWVPYGSHRYWMDGSGRIAYNKWIYTGGQWYYLKSNGYMAANEWVKYGSYWYWMDSSGKITRNKMIQTGGYSYYLKSNGYMAANEWVKYGSDWYWATNSGSMARNRWIYSGGQWYYLKSNTKMAANEWVAYGSHWYWMNSSGAITYNKWIYTGGAWYYLKSNGFMASNEWVWSGSAWYWMNKNGKMAANQWVYSGAWYYLKSNGCMAANEWINDKNNRYWIDAGGKWVH